ncbi:MAG TPA: hypothetical protein VLA11_07870 [Woeseiaceae bacterium]|jgi:hypothetical protein|nr:hypothetical protein [Woeseiaceae bacterium]
MEAARVSTAFTLRNNAACGVLAWHRDCGHIRMREAAFSPAPVRVAFVTSWTAANRPEEGDYLGVMRDNVERLHQSLR